MLSTKSSILENREKGEGGEGGRKRRRETSSSLENERARIFSPMWRPNRPSSPSPSLPSFPLFSPLPLTPPTFALSADRTTFEMSAAPRPRSTHSYTPLPTTTDDEPPPSPSLSSRKSPFLVWALSIFSIACVVAISSFIYSEMSEKSKPSKYEFSVSERVEEEGGRDEMEADLHSSWFVLDRSWKDPLLTTIQKMGKWRVL